MAYYPPRFNLWCQVQRILPPSGVRGIVGYTKCQLRGPSSHVQPGFTGSAFEVLFPKWTDVRGVQQAPSALGDWIQIAGCGNRFAVLVSVCDKGAGFPNEYRLGVCTWIARTTSPPSPLNTVDGLGVVDSLLAPPGGFVEVPLLPQLGWAFP